MLDAVKNGATYTPFNKPGVAYYKLIRADGPEPWGGRHSIFVDVWDVNGNRVVGVPVTFWWQGGSQIKPTETKQGEPFALDFPMFASGRSYGVRVGDNSDQIFGLGLRAYQPHVVYKLIFQETVGDELEVQEPDVPVSKDRWTLYRNGVLVFDSEA